MSTTAKTILVAAIVAALLLMLTSLHGTGIPPVAKIGFWVLGGTAVWAYWLGQDR